MRANFYWLCLTLSKQLSRWIDLFRSYPICLSVCQIFVFQPFKSLVLSCDPQMRLSIYVIKQSLRIFLALQFDRSLTIVKAQVVRASCDLESSNLLGVRCRWWKMFLNPLHRVFFFGNVLSPSTSRSCPRALVYSSGPMIAIWSPDPTSRALTNSGRLGGSSRPAPLRPTGGELGRTVGGQEGLLVYLPRASQSGPGTRSPSRQNCTKLLFGVSLG